MYVSFNQIQQIENSINTILTSNNMVVENWKELDSFNLKQFRNNYVKTIDVILNSLIIT